MIGVPRTESFGDVSIILPVVNETTSLQQTVRIIRDEAGNDVREILVVVCERTTREAMATIEQLRREIGSPLVMHRQHLPFLGGALREAFDLARGSHVVLMASDLETDPHLVKDMIAAEKGHPAGIVTASRWIRGGAFHGYSRIKLLLNWVFQRCLSALYRTHLTDMTYAYRIMPTRLVQAIHWEELRHPFLLETMVKPLRLGVRVTEIPAVWSARTEGESQNTFLRNFVYLRIGVKTRLASKASLLRAVAPAVPSLPRQLEQ